MLLAYAVSLLMSYGEVLDSHTFKRSLDQKFIEKYVVDPKDKKVQWGVVTELKCNETTGVFTIWRKKLKQIGGEKHRVKNWSHIPMRCNKSSEFDGNLHDIPIEM